MHVYSHPREERWLCSSERRDGKTLKFARSNHCCNRVANSLIAHAIRGEREGEQRLGSEEREILLEMPQWSQKSSRRRKVEERFFCVLILVQCVETSKQHNGEASIGRLNEGRSGMQQNANKSTCISDTAAAAAEFSCSC